MPTFDRAYFDALYRENIDPWHFRTSAYEHAKYAKTLAALPQRRFRRCLELGCSIGELTNRLMARCDRVVAVDTSDRALAEAATHCASTNVEFRRIHLPDGDLGDGYDLVLASEVLYYLDVPSLTALSRRLCAVAAPEAWLVSVHWTGPTDYPLDAAEATRICFEAAAIRPVRSSLEAGFRLDVGRFHLHDPP